MCYSAMVKQNIKNLKLIWDIRTDYAIIEEMFMRRLANDKIKISKAFEDDFREPANQQEARIKKLIEEFKSKQLQKFEGELLKQEKRLKEAEQGLTIKQTKKLLDEKRIAGNKIANLGRWIEAIKREHLIPEDSRIFPMHFSPILVKEGSALVLKLARYHCRPSGMPENIDFKFNGLYNARIDNLDNNFWKTLFGKHHAFFVVEKFYENVSRHNYEHRDLAKEEKEENVVVEFTPSHEMYIASLYDFWGIGAEGFYSFAALTSDPTPEITRAGHDRLMVALSKDQIGKWISPLQQNRGELLKILQAPESLHFDFKIAPA